jgi:hypothetical protein
MILRKWPALIGTISGFAVSAVAADLPKEGTFNGTYTGIGTYKTIKIGDRALTRFDENGVQVTNGFANHVTFNCWGTNEVTNGEAVSQGYCVGTDPTGDLIEGKFTNDKHTVGDKAFKGSFSFVAGTGKFAGISGTVANVHSGAEFRPLVEGTYVSYVALEGNYKLP